MKLSILSPLKIKSKSQFNLFCKCLDSYCELIKNPNVEFIVVNESTNEFKDLVFKRICDIKHNTTFLKVTGFVNSIRSLIQHANSDYTMFILDDVETFLNNEQIFDCVNLMDMHSDICQVKIGGGKVSFKYSDTEIDKYKKTHQCVDVNKSKMWVNDNLNEDYTYIISQWNSITRTNLLKTLDSEYEGNARTWHQYVTCISELFIKYEYHMNTKTAWLDLICGLYAWGRCIHTFNKCFDLYKKRYIVR